MTRGRRWRVLSLVAIFTAAATGWADSAVIRWRTDVPPAVVEFGGLPPDIAEKATRHAADLPAVPGVGVFAEPADASVETKASLPPMAGTWENGAGLLRFRPQFPLTPGVRYRAEYRPRQGEPVVAYFDPPAAKPGPPTEVAQVFPTAEVLPENQLKFYLQFSAPMSRGRTYEHVHVRDAAGTIIDLPFLELDEELWDPSMTRLTLLIDPGRIKRGVKPLEDIGPVFERGKNYSLTVEAACRDAAGQPLRATFEKSFRIDVADRTPPDPRRWVVRPAAAGTRDPLVVEFDEPLDQALALRLIRVRHEGTTLAGEPALRQHERVWTLVPSEPWKRGAYRLIVQTTIEDLAGNNIGKTFDVDLASGGQRRLAEEEVAVEFEVN